MNLYDLIAQSQNGQALDNIANQFGLDRDQAEAAVRQLAPALGAGLSRNTEDGKGLADLLESLDKGNHQRYAEDPALLGASETVKDGNGILGHLFGSKAVSRKVADHASAQTGIGSALLKKMLPVIATMIMGALAKKATGAGSREIADSVVKKASRRSGSMLGRWLAKTVTSGLVAFVLKKLVFGSGKGKRTSIFGSLLDKDGDGSYVDDLIGMAAKGLLK
jgi:hypothetical protein